MTTKAHQLKVIRGETAFIRKDFRTDKKRDL